MIIKDEKYHRWEVKCDGIECNCKEHIGFSECGCNFIDIYDRIREAKYWTFIETDNSSKVLCYSCSNKLFENYRIKKEIKKIPRIYIKNIQIQIEEKFKIRTVFFENSLDDTISLAIGDICLFMNLEFRKYSANLVQKVWEDGYPNFAITCFPSLVNENVDCNMGFRVYCKNESCNNFKDIKDGYAKNANYLKLLLEVCGWKSNEEKTAFQCPDCVGKELKDNITIEGVNNED